jgi:Transglycosylase SLT domain
MRNIDADLLEAMAQVESGGDPLTVSPRGALGIMQLMPATASTFSVFDPFDPVANVMGAADFLDYLRSRFANNPKLQGCRLCWPHITWDPAQWRSTVAYRHIQKRVSMCGA